MNSSLFYISFVLILCQVHGQHQTDSTTTTIPPESFQSFPHVAGVEDDLTHECLRDCSRDTLRKRCYYKFKVEWYVSVSKACYDCPFNITDCFRPYCVALDGRSRPIVTVNRRIPGPSIQVCERDEIIVDLENDLLSDSTTIHWHGMHQYGTPYMDGVPFVTQCPILPGTSFRYHFIANPAGTHFWHSHIGFQREDGMFGSLIVRPRDDAHAHLYDVDDSEHVMILNDWFEMPTIGMFMNHHREGHGNALSNLLVNGLGKYLPLHKDNVSTYTPLYEFLVKPGLRYRFRSINSPIQPCPVEISMDNHTLLMIASDGHNIEPIEVESFVTYGGERWDFIINASQPSGVYWVKYRGLVDCVGEHFSTYQIAVLRYEGAEGFPNKPEDVDYNFTRREGLQLNTLNAAPENLTNVYNVADVRSFNLIEEPSTYAQSPDYKFWLDFDFYTRSNDWFHLEDFYPNGVEEYLQLELPQISNISNKLPNVPLLSQPDEVDQTMYCNSTSRTDCTKKLCHCTHILNIDLGSLVELILIDTGKMVSNHPFHIHGYSFAVLGIERLGETTTLQFVQDLDKEGKLLRNFVNPPLKDSVTVPSGGYTVIRFIAKNPGYWLFHCHVSFHNEVGMSLILHVGEKKHLPPVPSAFPECRSWWPEPTGDLQDNINRWLNH